MVFIDKTLAILNSIINVILYVLRILSSDYGLKANAYSVIFFNIGVNYVNKSH